MALNPGITFLYTNSFDGTSDLIVKHLGSTNVFRFNFDLWADYKLRIDSGDFEIQNPSGRTLRPEDVAKVYWRKPIVTRELFPEQPCSIEKIYIEDELWYAMRELVNLLWEKGKVVLAEPFAENRVGKFVQMRVAEGLFEVPPWRFLRGMPECFVHGKESVAKSLTLNRVADRAVNYAAKVPEHKLDPGEPWFLQDYVDAEADVAVIFIRGDLFAFELDRNFLHHSIDWRVCSLDPKYSKWRYCKLPRPLEIPIREYMTLLSLDYGRLDLLRKPSGDYVFLEVNPHGEWSRLDPRGELGVLDAIIREVSPQTPVHPIPVRPWFYTAE